MLSRLAEAQRQHWLAACHLLMVADPATGDGAYAIYRGLEADLRPGWNRRRFGPGRLHRELYTFISADTGTTTPVRPDVPDSLIHEVIERKQPLAQRELWRVAMGHAGQLATLGIPDLPRERIEHVMRSVARAHERDRDFRERSVAMLARLHQETEAGDGEISDVQRRQHASEIVRDYLAFELSGFAASQLLPMALSARRVWPGEPIARRSVVELGAMIDHLADLTYRLLTRRNACDAHAFYRMTYLGCLYGNTIALLAHERANALGDDAVELERLQRQAQLAEEEVVHHGFPTFILPAFLALPDDGLRYVARAIGARDLESVPMAKVAHPAVKAIIERWRSAPGAFNPLTEYYDLLATPSSCPDISDLVAGDYSVLPGSARNHGQRDV